MPQDTKKSNKKYVPGVDDDFTPDEELQAAGFQDDFEPDPPPPGFFSRAMEMLNPGPMIEESWEATKKFGPYAPFAMGAKGGVDMLRRIVEKVKETPQRPEALIEGTPVIGPVYEKLSEDLKAGNLPGAAGTTAGLLGPTLATGGAARLGGPGLLKRWGETQYERIIQPTTRAAKAQTEKVVPELIRRGKTAGTFPGLRTKIGVALDDATKALDDVWKRIPDKMTFSTKPLIKAMDDTIELFMAEGQKTVISPTGQRVLQKVKAPISPEAVSNLREVRNLIEAWGDKVSPQTLRRARKIWDREVADAGGYALPKTIGESRALFAKREGASAIRRELVKKHPDLAVVNAEYSFWQQADDIMRQTELRRRGQSVPLGEQLIGASGLAGGLVHGAVQGVVTGASAATAIKAFRSTGWRTMSAVTKDRIATLLMSGKAEEAVALMSLALTESQGKEE